MDGDRLLLCSDGLTNMVTEDQIQAILETAPKPQDAANRLIKAANRAGGIDNTTVLVLDIHEAEGDAGGREGASRRGDYEERSPEGASTAIGAPQRRPRPSRATINRWSLRAGVVVVAIAALFFATRFYLDRQWYVGEAHGHVAVYQGIPAEVAGVRLSHLDLETDIAVTDVTKLPLYQGLAEGITANDRTDALASVEQMRADVRALSGGS